MSSTNRSNARETHVSDYYITPIIDIDNFISIAIDNIPILKEYLNEGIILDPCAGGDEINCMSYPTAIKLQFPNAKIKTMDIREDSRAEIKKDYITYDLDYKPNIIITNPPFNIAKEIIQKAINDVDDNGYVIMLQRLNFMGSKDRYEFWKNNMAEYIFVHHKRLKFTSKGTDSIEYAHYIWRKGYNPKYSKTIII